MIVWWSLIIWWYVMQGYGFVDFESPTSALAAVHELQGQGIQVDIWKLFFFMFLRLYNQFCPRLKWPDRRSRTRRTSTLRICPTPWRRATSRPCSRLMDRLLWTSSTLSSTPTSSWQGILRDTDHHYYHLFIMITITIGCVNSNSPGHQPTVSRGRVRQDGE